MGAAAAVLDAAGARFLLEFRAVGGAWQREPLWACCSLRFEDALPVRPFRFEKGLRNFAGWWYFATTGIHVGFESWLERDHLMLMDFDPGVRAVSSQPFWLRWRAGQGRVRRRAPGFFARRDGGPGVVVDVGHPDMADAAAYPETIKTAAAILNHPGRTSAGRPNWQNPAPAPGGPTSMTPSPSHSCH